MCIDPEGRDDRQRHGDRRDQGGPPVAQEDEHDDDGQRGTLQQGAHGGFVVAFDIADGVVDQGVADFRMGLGQLRQFGFDHAGDIDIAGALGAEDAERDHLLVAVQLGEGAGFLEGVGHLAQVAQPDLAATRQHDPGFGQAFHRAGAGQRADRLFLAAELAPAAADIDIGGAELLVDFSRRDAERHQPVGVELDLDFAADAADPVDPADILEALEPALDDIVHEPGKLFQRHAGSRRGVALDRLAFDIDPLDDRVRRSCAAGPSGSWRWRP